MRLAISCAVVLLASTAHADAPREFLPEVQLIYRIAACGGTAPVPATYTKAVDTHCKAITPYLDKFKTEYFGTARTWMHERMPKGLPSQVVYPFGGGDLLDVFVPFPDATEITTLSLELAGDPTKLTTLSATDLDKTLYTFRTQVGSLVNIGLSSSVNMSAGQQSALPSQLAQHLIGLTAIGAELVSVKYFRVDDAGAIVYLTQAELDADTKRAKSLRGNWKSPTFSQSFGSVEVQYKKPNDAKVRTFRHVASNLDNDGIKKAPGVLAHLAAKGKAVTHMVKGAHYLLWTSDFSALRKHLVDNLTFMVSDATGIATTHATAASLTQEVFGKYEGPINDNVLGGKEDLAMQKLWKTRAAPVPFRFGYLDKTGHANLMFTRR